MNQKFSVCQNVSFIFDMGESIINYSINVMNQALELYGLDNGM